MTALPLLSGQGLGKRFGHVVALDGADFELAAGEVLAVVGDNGAGKSTLIKILSGALEPDGGELRLGGQPTRFRGPIEARRAGIETVYQDLAVAPAMDVAQNLFLGRELRRRGWWGTWLRRLDDREMRRQASAHLAALGVDLPSMSQPVEGLSGGQRQAVAVARAAAFASRLIILDEPTAALGVRESATVLALVRRIRDRGLAVVLVSHNMPQVFEVADRIHVQRLGRRAAVVSPRTHSMSDVVALLTGAEVA
jgi:fructose transport system ATP-binding protein